MKHKHMSLPLVATLSFSKEQIIANKHKRLLTLVDLYNTSTDPVTRMELRLDAMDMVRQIEKLQVKA